LRVWSLIRHAILDTRSRASMGRLVGVTPPLFLPRTATQLPHPGITQTQLIPFVSIFILSPSLLALIFPPLTDQRSIASVTVYPPARNLAAPAIRSFRLPHKGTSYHYAGLIVIEQERGVTRPLILLSIHSLHFVTPRCSSRHAGSWHTSFPATRQLLPKPSYSTHQCGGCSHHPYHFHWYLSHPIRNPRKGADTGNPHKAPQRDRLLSHRDRKLCAPRSCRKTEFRL
jgi:hypothetical protein